MKSSLAWLGVVLLVACSSTPDTGSDAPSAGASNAGGQPNSAAGSAGTAHGGSSAAGAAASAGALEMGGSVGASGAAGSAAPGGSAGAASSGGTGTAGAGASGGVVATRQKILDYLGSISGTKTIAGQHNKEPNTDPAHWTNYVTGLVGKTPGLWSGDFLFEKPDVDARGTMIAEAQKQFEAGALINLMWHACAPTVGVSCKWGEGVSMHLSDPQWSDLVTEGGMLNGVWKQRMDLVAAELQKLEDAGVVVMFRPFHEQNQGMFWWAGRTGDSGTKKLYRLTHDYFVKSKGLENIIWVWDMQDLAGYEQAIPSYNPGFDYFDVAALDVYEGFNAQKYQAMVDVAAGQKLIAIGECAQLPKASDLASAPQFVFFMDWAELIQDNNSTDAVKTLYAADRVLTRDELPGWK